MKHNPQPNPVPYRSPANTTRSRGKQARPDDGFHTRPVRSPRDGRRKVVIAVAATACVIAAIFVLRATGDRDERLPETIECTDLYDADICDLLEKPE